MSDDPEPALRRAVRDSKAPAIARAAAILRLLGRSDAPLPLQAIARALDLVPSTCLYVLRALMAEELVSCDAATKRYALEAGVLTLARGWLRRNPFTDLAQPVLDGLGERFGVTMLGVQIVGLDHMIVVAASRTGQSFRLSAEVGSRFPALISATGRCLAAFGEHDVAALEERFAALRWDDPPSFAEWRDQVARTAADGYAVDEGNYLSGITVVAAPVWRAPRRLGHALVAIGFGQAIRRAGMATVGEALAAAAATLSARLCGEAGPAGG